MKSAFKILLITCVIACIGFPVWLFFLAAQVEAKNGPTTCTNEADEDYPCKWKDKENKGKSDKDKRADCKAKGKKVVWLEFPQCTDSGDPDDCVAWDCRRRTP